MQWVQQQECRESERAGERAAEAERRAERSKKKMDNGGRAMKAVRLRVKAPS
jgi:hypothetical protein